ncbi:MAG: SAM-dependent methyltransferase [Crocinitomicaceae bacterium]|jgi:SAM-dependent methyltransferase
MGIENKEWFAEWFDTSYYHILYKNRDNEEAKRFITRLVSHLPLKEGARVLDLACGKGRHSITLSELGFDVLGADLSHKSISCALKFAHDGLNFQVSDMRKPLEGKFFEGIFNLFTSFGYFDSLLDNEKVVSAIRQMLVDDGILVIDFMNAHRVIEELVASEIKESEGITFSIDRTYDGSHIFKKIKFVADNEEHTYTERVQALHFDHFKSLLEGQNFEILRTFGDFDLNAFDERTSDRLIIVAQKKIWD